MYMRFIQSNFLWLFRVSFSHFCSSFGDLSLYFFLQLIYRIKLPGPAILGEGKPENQNHSIIFTRGEGLQTIDMNQVSLPIFILSGPSALVSLTMLIVVIILNIQQTG